MNGKKLLKIFENMGLCESTENPDEGVALRVDFVLPVEATVDADDLKELKSDLGADKIEVNVYPDVDKPELTQVYLMIYYNDAPATKNQELKK